MAETNRLFTQINEKYAKIRIKCVKTRKKLLKIIKKPLPKINNTCYDEGEKGGNHMKVYNALHIAKWFLARNRNENDSGETELISNLKLQKLLYYVQGCALGLLGEPIFKEDIVAWKHGPVVEVVYHNFKGAGACGIIFNEDYDFKSIDKEHQEILEEVYENFGQFSAWKLREMTHQEEPWLNTEQGEVISRSLIRNFFEENYIA